MKDVFIVYDGCCFYEIVILNYFMKFVERDVIFCSLTGEAIRSMEGYSVNVDKAIGDIDENEVASFVVTGGDISTINNEKIHGFLRNLKRKDVLICAICAGVDVLEDAGVLNGIESTHLNELDICNDKKVITARANAYVDFAIEVAKELEFFEDEADLQETIEFWKYHKRV